MSIRRLKKNAGRKGTGRDLLNEDLEAARTEVEREKARRKQLEASMEGLEERAAAAETEAANASQAGKHNAERVAELPGLIGTGQSVNTLSNADNIIEKGVAAEDAVQKTGQVTEDQYDAINKLNELAQLSGTNMKAILSILAISHAAHGDQQKDIADIKTQFEALRARTPPAF